LTPVSRRHRPYGRFIAVRASVDGVGNGLSGPVAGVAGCGVGGLLDGVSDVDWASQCHAYGSAEHVPQWLAGLLSPLTAAEALDHFDASVYHQGGAVYPAAAAALPFLIRLAAHPEVPERSGILDLLSRLAGLAHTMVEPWRSKPEAVALRAAFSDAFGVFSSLLDDEDRAVRASAAEVLVEWVDRADTIADEFQRRYAAEPDPGARVEIVWLIGRLADALSEARRRSVREWLDASMPPPGDPLRLALLVVHRRIDSAAVRSRDLLAALDGARHPTGFQDPVAWIEQELAEERPARLVLARRGLDRAVQVGDRRGMASAGAVMMKWRSATADLVPAIARTLRDRRDLAEDALHLLAAAGEVSRPYVEDIAANVAEPGRTGRLAAWALARLGDVRAVPTAVRSLSGSPGGYAMGGSHDTDQSYWLDQDPGIADVLTPLSASADRVVPAIRGRLRIDEKAPTAYQLGEVVIAFGARAADAVPEFAAMLGTDRHRTACRVLAALGPAAAAARDQLARSTGDDGGAAAWALFRVSGDPEPFLRAPDVWGGTHDIAAAAVRLADFGPLAGRHRDRVEHLLQAERSLWASWEGVELAHAHYRMTGDAALCLEVFDTALDPLRHRRQLPVIRTVLRYLAELGPAAVRFEPLLHLAVNQDERLVYSGGWRGIAEDDEAVELATGALESMTRHSRSARP
jgi:hypothetical protein